MSFVETAEFESHGTVSARHLSPAILEQQIKRLLAELEQERREHGKTRAERDCYKERILFFERLCNRFADTVSALQKQMDNLLKKQ